MEGLYPPPCGQAGVLPTADDQVVEDADVEQRQRLLQALGDFAVGFTGLWIPARVVVEEDDGDGVEVQGTLCYDSRVDIAPVDGAAEEMFGCEDVMLGVEKTTPKTSCGR